MNRPSPTTLAVEAETCRTTQVCDPVAIADRVVEFSAMRTDGATCRITIAVTGPTNTGEPVAMLLHFTPAELMGAITQALLEAN